MFSVKTIAIGVVEKIGKEDQDVNLQFLEKTNKGSHLVNVKILSAKKADLERFVGKKVELEDIVINKIYDVTFYKI